MTEMHTDGPRPPHREAPGAQRGKPGLIGAHDAQREPDLPSELGACGTQREPDQLGARGAQREPGPIGARGAKQEPGPIGACEECLRRSWLLAVLSARLAYQARDRGRLLDLLALGDRELVQAIGGRRRTELRERYARFTLQDIHWSTGVETICRHRPNYPHGLKLAGDRAPRMLYVADRAQRLGELGSEPTVAIVGSRRATDYGMEMARSLARGLAASGVRVAGSLSDGIAVAALAGALEAQGKTLTVIDGGLDVACPARRRALYERLCGTGCAVAELPCGCGVRQWCYPARERIVAGLAELTIVVEADEGPGELLGARVAKALGRTVAAMPGRVTSPVSRGTHTLLMEGAALVRGPGDALELLYRGDSRRRSVSSPGVHRTPRKITEAPNAATLEPRRRATPQAPEPNPRLNATPRVAELEPRLQAMLEQVGAGRDTPAKLTAGEDTGEVLLALSELEARGLLTRGDGGRYLPRESLAGQ